MNVIFIDDDEDLNFLLDRMCMRLEIIDEYFIASSAQQALDYLVQGKQAIDIIFVDLNMPVMNGFAFIEEYEKNLSASFPETLVYVVSSSVRANDRRKALTYESVEDFLVKPLMDSHLEEIYRHFKKISAKKLHLVENSAHKGK